MHSIPWRLICHCDVGNLHDNKIERWQMRVESSVWPWAYNMYTMYCVYSPDWSADYAQWSNHRNAAIIGVARTHCIMWWCVLQTSVPVFNPVWLESRVFLLHTSVVLRIPCCSLPVVVKCTVLGYGETWTLFMLPSIQACCKFSLLIILSPWFFWIHPCVRNFESSCTWPWSIWTLWWMVKDCNSYFLQETPCYVKLYPRHMMNLKFAQQFGVRPPDVLCGMNVTRDMMVRLFCYRLVCPWWWVAEKVTVCIRRATHLCNTPTTIQANMLLYCAVLPCNVKAVLVRCSFPKALQPRQLEQPKL